VFGAGIMINEVDVHVGRRLRSRRRLMDLTQAELGALVGVSFQQIQKYECATHRMSVAMLWKLARVLEVDAQYFFGGFQENAKAPRPPAVRGFGGEGASFEALR
jgi:transcriptional regulator with XRE-family HTH domain